MKKLLFAGLVAVAMSLGACASTGGLSATDITSFEDALMADTLALCAFEPNVASIASLIADAVVPDASAVTTAATTLAGQICKAETTASGTSSPTVNLRRGAVGPTLTATVVVNGKAVPVAGHFINK
jgi:hypothetical protein